MGTTIQGGDSSGTLFNTQFVNILNAIVAISGANTGTNALTIDPTKVAADMYPPLEATVTVTGTSLAIDVVENHFVAIDGAGGLTVLVDTEVRFEIAARGPRWSVVAIM